MSDSGKYLSKIMTAALFFFILNIQLINAQYLYTAVDAESNIGFVIKNFGFNTNGNFTGLKGTIHFNPADLSTAKFDVTVDATSINTGNRTRDKHLRKEGYFDVAKFPLMSFKSSQVIRDNKVSWYLMKGNLTIKGVTKVVQFLFSATTTNTGYLFKSGDFEINRRDFNVGSSSFSLQDKLKIELIVSAKK